MEQKFTLGRGSKNDIVIDETMISFEHLEITIHEPGKLLIRDLDSTNTTKVNGREIKGKVISPTDKLELGSYNVNTVELFEQIQKLSHKNKIDFTKEFGELEAVYNDYSRKKNKLIKKHKSKPLMIRAGLTIVVMILVFVFSSELQEYRLFLIMGVGIFGGIFATMGTSTEKLKAATTDLEIELEKKYNCPKCTMALNTTKTWKYWASKKKCPKCKAIWCI